MVQVRAINGDWMKDGYLAGRDTMFVIIKTDGSMCDDEFFEPLYLRQYGNDCPVITNGVWAFAPDESELRRLGLVPEQMIPDSPLLAAAIKQAGRWHLEKPTTTNHGRT